MNSLQLIHQRLAPTRDMEGRTQHTSMVNIQQSTLSPSVVRGLPVERMFGIIDEQRPWSSLDNPTLIRMFNGPLAF